ncbi:MAG: GAF domain-containing protein [Alphaproteobacteria bacterium]|nr:GAF domain-containing protein [Alphaproteobacteria bacterium]
MNFPPSSVHENSSSSQNSIVRSLAQGERLNAVLAEICESLEERLPGVMAAIQIVAPNGGQLIHGSAPSLPDSFIQAIDGIQISPSSSTCGTAAALGERVITADIAVDPKWRNLAALARTHGLRACWSEPILSGNGVVIGTLAIYRTVIGTPEETEIEIVNEFRDLASLAIQHRNSIDAHAEAHARLSNLTANIPGIVLQWSVGIDNRKALTFMSGGVSEIAGVSREALLKSPKRLLRNIQTEDRRDLLHALDECALSGDPVTRDFRVHSGSEKVLWLRLLVRPRRRPDDVTVCDALGLDITDHMEFERRLEESQRELNTKFIELQRTKARLEVQTEALMRTTDEVTKARDMAEDASRAKSEFLSNMSHELRTPLNAIMGFSDIIREQTFGPVGSIKYRDYARDINDAGRHLLELINDVLDFSKIESGNEELYEEWVDVHDAIRSVTRMLHDQAQRSDVSLVVEAPDKLPPLYADEMKVRQILINLLSNALKFTGSNGTVTLTAWYSDSGGYVFQVEDTGIGISLEDIPKALGLFGQVDSAFNRRYEGTGLGLPLSKSLAEMHGGSLDIQSQINVGTTVTVRFPTERVVRKSIETH